MAFNWRRTLALAKKETRQIIHDPSVILIAFVLPVVMLFLFAFAVSLDIKRIPIGIVLESDTADASELAAAFAGSRYFTVTPARNRQAIEQELTAGHLRGLVVIPENFTQRLSVYTPQSLIQVLTDGTQPNTANFVGAYAQSVINAWLDRQSSSSPTPTLIEPRFWFNPEIESRRFLVPGAIAVVMTIIGTLLTALVIAREWERGTMEAIMSTPASVGEIILGKLLPYFFLGLIASICATLLAILVFDVPLRGSWLALISLTAAFLLPALGQGLLISTLAKSQFIAGQAALLSGFLPAFLLSGFLYEIDSMPASIQLITHIIPARYFVASLQTVFLAGDVWAVLLPDIAALLAMGLLLFTVVRLITRKRLDH